MTQSFPMTQFHLPPDLLWTEEKTAKLKELWCSHTSSQIGDALGCSRSAVIGKAWRLGLTSKRPSGPVERRAWTVAEERELVRLWTTGDKLEVCAATMNRTVASLAGKAKRMGLPIHPNFRRWLKRQ